MSSFTTWELTRKELTRQCERRRIDGEHYKRSQSWKNPRGFHPGPYLTVSFPSLFTDAALNFVAAYTGGDLISVTHEASVVYDWGTQATFRVPLCEKWPHPSWVEKS